ncbi:MAG: diversity-generating retroelement protein Avd, partial [Planctomycetes bacterium]|nr:diversity-generating retroelement protein Avd [Planctomycetota bacterium]
STEPIVFQQAYDLTQWYAQRTPGFPKTHRLTLGDRLEHALFDLLAFLQDVAYGKNRAVVLSKAQDQVDRLRLWNRLARDLKCIRPKQYTYAAERIEEIGRQVGGWTRSSRGQALPARASDGTARPLPARRELEQQRRQHAVGEPQQEPARDLQGPHFSLWHWMQRSRSLP